MTGGEVTAEAQQEEEEEEEEESWEGAAADSLVSSLIWREDREGGSL